MELPTSSGFMGFFWQAEPLWILQKFNHLVPDSWESSHPPTFPSKTRQKPKRTRGAREVLRTEGRDPVTPGRVPAASTEGANMPPWSLSAPVNSFQGGISWSSISSLKTVAQNSACPRERHTCHCDPVDLHVGFRSPCVRRATGPLSQPRCSLKLMRRPCLVPNSSPGLPSLLWDCSIILWLRNQAKASECRQPWGGARVFFLESKTLRSGKSLKDPL